jgi:hypothetical protein
MRFKIIIVKQPVKIRNERYRKRIRKTGVTQMQDENVVYRAIHRIGGPSAAAALLKVSTASVHRWIRKGQIKRYDKAAALAKASGFTVESLRPTYPVLGYGPFGAL